MAAERVVWYLWADFLTFAIPNKSGQSDRCQFQISAIDCTFPANMLQCIPATHSLSAALVVLVSGSAAACQGLLTGMYVLVKDSATTAGHQP